MSTTPDKPLSHYQRETYTLDMRRDLGYGMEYLAKAMSARMNGDVDNNVARAIRALTEFVGSVKPVPDMTEEEVNLSRALHTYMRKGMDGPLSTLLYRLKADEQGHGVWVAFVKGAHANKLDLREALRDADSYYRDHDELPDNLTMLCALQLWPEPEWKRMTKAFKTEGWL